MAEPSTCRIGSCQRHQKCMYSPCRNTQAGQDALLREIFLHGHAEGWRGNQLRRDVQHVDAVKGWELYVSNGALEKTKSRTLPTPTAERLALIEELREAIVELWHDSTSDTALRVHLGMTEEEYAAWVKQ